MGALTVLALVGMVTAFLIRVLGGFPADGSPASIPASAPKEESYSAESINEATQLFSSKYMSVVDEIISFQTDPDLRRAEARRQEMVSYGGALGGALKVFAVRMQSGLEELVVRPDGPDAELEPLPVQ